MYTPNQWFPDVLLYAYEYQLDFHSYVQRVDQTE
jgi:hypothetical protein